MTSSVLLPESLDDPGALAAELCKHRVLFALQEHKVDDGKTQDFTLEEVNEIVSDRYEDDWMSRPLISWALARLTEEGRVNNAKARGQFRYMPVYGDDEVL